MKIGFIGCGNMACAIIKGIINSRAVNVKEIYVFDVYSPACEKIGKDYRINILNDAVEITEKCDIVILAVKPNVIFDVLNEIKTAVKKYNPLLISIAAGKTIQFISSQIDGNSRIIRVMPNINAKVGAAISAYTANEFATDDDKRATQLIFSSVGEIIYLDESSFPLFGVLGGCTPALAYMFIDELARAGVKNGMKKDIALRISAQAVLGSAKMILESKEHPYELIDMVCSPGGTTIEAVTSLQEDGFNDAIHKAVEKAVEKDKRL